MVSVDEELKAAKAAKTAINALLTTTSKSVLVAALNKADRIAVLNLASGGALNAARTNVGIALSNLLNGRPTLEKIEKPKGAVEEWINQLRT